MNQQTVYFDFTNAPSPSNQLVNIIIIIINIYIIIINIYIIIINIYIIINNTYKFSMSLSLFLATREAEWKKVDFRFPPVGIDFRFPPVGFSQIRDY